MSEEILPPVSGHSLIYSETPVKCAYLFGGWDGARLFNDLWMFRVDEQSWCRLRRPEELLKQLQGGDDDNEEGEESKQPRP